jgi:hypothetical protein
MKINNKLTNEIISLNRIDIPGNRIVYSVYDLIGKEIRSNVYQPGQPLSGYLNQTVNFHELAYGELITNVFNENCETSEDDKNWIHSLRVMRLIVPRTLIIESLEARNELSAIINRLIDENAEAEEKFIFKNANHVNVYVNLIADGDRAVVMPYIQSGQITVQIKE